MTKPITATCQGCGKRYKKSEMALFAKSPEDMGLEEQMYGERTTGMPYKVQPTYYLCRDCYPAGEPGPDFICVNPACVEVGTS